MNKIVTYIALLPFLLISSFLVSCGESDDEAQKYSFEEGVEFSETKDQDIQRFNLERKRDLSSSTSPCDTVSLIEYVLDTYPAGTYIVSFDRTISYNIPKPAVLYYNKEGGNMVFAIVARSRPGERLIEAKNIVGFDQSFIDLDSTKLGTAFFYLTLFECVNNSWNIIWEAPIPNHGGFNRHTVEMWQPKNLNYVRVNFHDARGTGHIDYNYFFVDGIRAFPHLLMTFEAVNYKRSMGNINNDKFPDFYQYVYYDLGDRLYIADSVGFVWSEKDSLYVNTRNKKQTRPY
jgi:hypothetical protein